jgi:hypothetical protein
MEEMVPHRNNLPLLFLYLGVAPTRQPVVSMGRWPGHLVGLWIWRDRVWWSAIGIVEV